MITLTDEMKEDCKNLFDLFDKDKDNKISSKEIGEVLRALGINPKTDLKEIMEKADKDKSGFIEYNEFLQIYAEKINEPDSPDDLVEAFKIFDADNDGFITKKELKHILTSMGQKLTDEDAERIILEADINRDGKIDYREFVEYFAKL
jgi:calmodulin